MLKFSCFLLVLLLQRFLICDQANVNQCHVHPSEYAYNFGSVQSAESTSANCRRYPNHLKPGIFTDQFIHCDGMQLKLADSNLGSEQYSSINYYEWPVSTSAHNLLFIFPTRVKLTTITLHYYSDSDRGLPRLRFFAVPDDFDIWDAPSAAYRHVEVAAVSPIAEPAGPRNVSVEFNFNTKKVLLFKDRNALAFAMSEVEFLICHYSVTTTPNNQSKGANMSSENNSHIHQMSSYNGLSVTMSYYSHTTTKIKSEISTVAIHTSSETQPILLANGLVLGTVIVLTVVLIVTIALALFFRKSTQQKIEFDHSYSTICSGKTQKLQPQSHHNPNDLYDHDQIQLSPLTGQTEVISKAETENINSNSQHQPTSDTEQHKEAVLQPNSLSLKQMVAEKSTPEQSNYAVVNKKQEESKYKGKANTASEKESAQSKQSAVRNVEELYTAVQKKPKSCAAEGEEVAPSIPPHTVEDLYTAVVKKPKCIAAEDTPPVPPHTVEELYTAVAKKSEEKALEDAEECPSIPQHTVEELYTALDKKPKGDNEKHAPPIPPYKVDCFT